MKYQQPYGISDPDAPYINGNPSTGTMGSIPPAASIEHPQREIANFIADTGGITPTDLNLHQLAESVQAGGVNYGDDVGTPNQLVVNLMPPPPALRKGLHVFTIVTHDNYAGGPTTLNVNSLGPKPVQHLDKSPLEESELKAGTMALFVYDGVAWQWMSAPYFNIVTGTLTAHRDYYVNPVTGNNTNDGLSLAKPFKTIQHAHNQCVVVNLNGYNINIHCAAGTYRESVLLRPLSGNGNVLIMGDEVTPSNCTINPPDGYCISWGSIFPTNGYIIFGFRLTSMVNGVYRGCGLYCGYGANRVGSMEFGPCDYAHVVGMSNCKITISGQRQGGAQAQWRITGGAVYHILMSSGSELINYAPDMIITNTPAFTYFMESVAISYMDAQWGSITGACTAGTKKFYVAENSVIHSGGKGVGYLPGGTAGIEVTGGVYT